MKQFVVRAKPETPGTVPPGPRVKKLKVAAIFLWIAAVLQILAGVVFIVLAPDEVDDLVSKALGERRISLFQVKAADAEMRVEFDQARESAIRTVRLWHGCDLLAGVLLFAGATHVRRRPLVATMTPLVLLFLVAFAKVFFQPSALMEYVFADLFVRVLVIGAASAAALAAFTAEPLRQQEESALSS